MFYLTTHSTHFIYGYMASDIWLRTILIVRKEFRCRHIGYSFRLTSKVILYASSHRNNSTYHGLCYTSRGALAGMRNNSMGPPHEGSIRRPIVPWANALTTELRLAPWNEKQLNVSTMKDRFDDPSHHGATSHSLELVIAQCVHDEGSIRRPIAPRSYISRPHFLVCCRLTARV